MHRRLGSVLVALVMTAGVWGAAFTVAIAPAQAHRDGCHAAHSCPSDTGSYVCGDTGNFSECPVAYKPPAPLVKSDVTPPPKPTVRKPSVAAGGVVRIPVSAERGSRIEVTTGPSVVATVTATGAAQMITVRTGSGRHSYRVSAIDSAGNRSKVHTLRVTADATPPRVRSATFASGSTEDSRTHVEVTTDPDTFYRLLVDGEVVKRGTTLDGRVVVNRPLANGEHTVALILRDEIGNERSVTRSVVVNVASLDVTASHASSPREAVQSFYVYGTPGAKAKVTVPTAAAKTARLAASGSAYVSFSLQDGFYGAPKVVMTDPVGRRGRSTIPAFVVDTVAPSLVARVLADRAAEGVLGFVINGEAGSEIGWTITDDTGAETESGTFTADGANETLQFDLPEGNFDVEVVASDEYGNTTTEQMAADLAPNPMTRGEFVTALALLLLGIAVILSSAWWVWKNRSRLERWRVSLVAGVATWMEKRRYDRAVSAHAAKVAHYREALARHQDAERAWALRGKKLSSLLESVRTDVGRGDAETSLKMKRGERVFCTVPGALVEMRSNQGVLDPTVVGRGEVVVTSLRVAFLGPKKREWAYDKLEAVRHEGTDRTMMVVSSRKTESGVKYSSPESTRAYIDVAIGDARGSRQAIIDEVELRLRSHQSSRPMPPQPPGPPPATPVAGKEKHARVHA